MEAREKALDGDWVAPQLGASRTKTGTVNAAIVSYYQSSAFTDGLAKSSQDMRRAILERFREAHGDKRIALLHKKALQAILNKKTPAAASNWRKALRGFIDHCLSLDMITVDPLAGVKLVSIKSNGHHPWEPEECAQFEAHHAVGTRARLGLRVAAAGRTVPLRRRPDGPAARPQRNAVAKAAEDRRSHSMSP